MEILRLNYPFDTAAPIYEPGLDGGGFVVTTKVGDNLLEHALLWHLANNACSGCSVKGADLAQTGASCTGVNAKGSAVVRVYNEFGEIYVTRESQCGLKLR